MQDEVLRGQKREFRDEVVCVSVCGSQGKGFGPSSRGEKSRGRGEERSEGEERRGNGGTRG